MGTVAKPAIRFNRHMLQLARESRGLTQTDLAQKIGVKQGTISKQEAGISEPHVDFIREASSTLSYTEDFFFESERLYGLPPFHYRRRKKLGAKALMKIVAEMNIRRIHLKVLLRSYEGNNGGTIPELDRDEYRGIHGRYFSVEDAARVLRELWLVPDGPIDNVVNLIEENGGVVIPCNFENDLIDAVSQRIDGMPVLFFVNMNAPSDRVRYTLCHELGHMVLHTTTVLGDDDMEVEADRFAGAFLYPVNDIRRQLVNFDLRQVANLKRYWKISMAAIAMRAFNLGMITPYQRKAFFIQLGKLGYRKAEPYEPEREYPWKVSRMLMYFRSVLNYSNSELATALFISEAEFRRMYIYEDEDKGERSSMRVPHLYVVN